MSTIIYFAYDVDCDVIIFATCVMSMLIVSSSLDGDVDSFIRS